MAPTQPPPESASPALAAGLAVTVTQIYVDGEAAILAAITLNARIALRSLDPATELARRSPAVQSAVRRIMDRAEHLAARAVPRALSEAYGRGHGIEQLAAEHAVRDVLGRLRTLRGGVLRWVGRLLGRLTAAMRTPNPRAMADHTLQQAAGRGITAFDTGRSLHVPYSVEQIVTQAAGTASMDGWMQRVRDEVGDYVIVNRSPTACPICRPWVGRILSISGADPDRPSVREARATGLWHPNCVHPALIWRPGFRWPDWAGTGTGGTQADYEATQRTRQIKRTIAYWQRREAVALDDTSKALARRKVRQWQTALRDHRRTSRVSALA